MLAGVVRAVLPWDGYTSGEGAHLWYEIDDPLAPGPTWVHHDHLASIDCMVGQRVAPGDLLGTCGKSGGWQCAHLHTEWLPAAPADGWTMWPYGWPVQRVAAAYYEPRAWWDAAAAKAQGARPEEVALILSGAQSAAVQAVVWGAYWRPEAADFAIEASWREEWRRGVWRGAPLSEEQLIPQDDAEGKPGGAFRLFEQGVCCWLPGQDASWNG